MQTSELFTHFHDDLKLPKREVEFARGFRSVIEAAFKAAGIVVVSTFLQGSLAKRTMIRPLKDVDLVVVLDRRTYLDLGVAGVFELIAETLTQALIGTYPDVVVDDPKKYAIPIELALDFPSFDVVPAFETPGDENDDILIGNTETLVWERSNTREMMRVVSAANGRTEGILVHVVRMVKNSVRQHFDDGIPGIAIEGVACRELSGHVPYAEGCTAIFRRAADEVARGRIDDPTNAENLIEKLADHARAWLDNKAIEAEKAWSLAEAGDHEEAWQWWYRIFGDPFPEPPSTTPDDPVGGGDLTSVMTGLHVGGESPTPTRAWSR